MPSGLLGGRSLYFVGSLDENRQIVWTCLSQNIDDSQLPAQCQNQSQGENTPPH